MCSSIYRNTKISLLSRRSAQVYLARCTARPAFWREFLSEWPPGWTLARLQLQNLYCIHFQQSQCIFSCLSRLLKAPSNTPCLSIDCKFCSRLCNFVCFSIVLPLGLLDHWGQLWLGFDRYTLWKRLLTQLHFCTGDTKQSCTFIYSNWLFC